MFSEWPWSQEGWKPFEIGTAEQLEISVMNEDELICAADKKFAKVRRLSQRIFHSKKMGLWIITLWVNTDAKGKRKSLEKLITVLLNVSKVFSSWISEEPQERWHEIACLTHARPDLCADVAELSQVATTNFNWNVSLHSNKIIPKEKVR